MKGADCQADPPVSLLASESSDLHTIPFTDCQAKPSKTKFKVQSCQPGLKLFVTTCQSLNCGFLIPSVDISFDRTSAGTYCPSRLFQVALTGP